ncbi:MAG: helix-turn-helix domain-containing protein, partial [Methyloceanibacter sp.]
MTTKSKNPLDNSATHLLHRAGQRAADIFAEEAKKGGLTPRQYAVLTAVSLEEGLPQAELVARTGIDRSTLAD